MVCKERSDGSPSAQLVVLHRIPTTGVEGATKLLDYPNLIDLLDSMKMVRLVVVDEDLWASAFSQYGGYVEGRPGQPFDKALMTVGFFTAPAKTIYKRLEGNVLMGSNTISLHYSDFNKREQGKLFVTEFPLEGLRSLMVKRISPAIYHCMHPL